GAGGGPPPVCGNGKIEPGEECDDGNNTDGDGCSNCVVDCSELGAYKDDQTHHCYFAINKKSDWLTKRAACRAFGPGEDLVAFAHEAEFASVKAAFDPTSYWTGGRDTLGDGSFTWSDGEPFTLDPGMPPWGTGEPIIQPGQPGCVAFIVTA